MGSPVDAFVWCIVGIGAADGNRAEGRAELGEELLKLDVLAQFLRRIVRRGTR